MLSGKVNIPTVIVIVNGWIHKYGNTRKMVQYRNKMQWTEERMQHAADWAKAVQEGYRANKSTENQSSLKWHQCYGSWCKHSSPIHPLGCLWHQIWTQRKGFQSPLPSSKQKPLMRSLGCIRTFEVLPSAVLTHHALAHGTAGCGAHKSLWKPEDVLQGCTWSATIPDKSLGSHSWQSRVLLPLHQGDLGTPQAGAALPRLFQRLLQRTIHLNRDAVYSVLPSEGFFHSHSLSLLAVRRAQIHVIKSYWLTLGVSCYWCFP